MQNFYQNEIKIKRNYYLCGVFRKRHKTFYLLNRFTNLHLGKDKEHKIQTIMEYAL